MRQTILAVCCAMLSACSGGTTPSLDAAAPHDTGTVTVDGTSSLDAGAAMDTGSGLDVGPTSDGPTDVDSGMLAVDTGTGHDAGGPSTWVMGYYVGYLESVYPPSAIDFTSLTHVAIGRVVPNPDGSLNTTFDLDATNGPAMAHSVVTLAHAAGRKAIVMLGGAGAHDGWLAAASPAHLTAFVANLVRLQRDYQFDGFDLDWEPVDASDQPELRAVATALRAALPTTILTIPVLYANANFPTVDPFWSAVAPLFDQMNIMSYGMAGAWDGWQTWHSSALQGESSTTPTSVANSVNAYVASGVPAAKMGVGIGFYGSCWSSPAMGPREALNGSTVVADDNVMSFANIMNDYYVAANHHWDDAARAPYLAFATPHGASQCTFVSYEDEQSVAAKGAYVRAHGLGGTIIWTINEGYRASQPVGARDALLTAVRHAFLE